jgi:hypothetical protein
MEPEGSLPCSKEVAPSPYPETESSPHFPTCKPSLYASAKKEQSSWENKQINELYNKKWTVD